MNKEYIEFEKVIPIQSQIQYLYKLLDQRDHSISHKSLPTLKEHEYFVRNHPYRSWYIVKDRRNLLGSFYIHNDNSIGINLIEDSRISILETLIEFIHNKYQPLPEIKSVRGSGFFINVPISNTPLIQALQDLKKSKIQISFLL